ncbi:MAG: gamma-glutamyltransferase [Gammaproteobacteria bacterium]|nr:MAG: gamma-glutamyltransferase [Gammaproteobacteria bacterium]
MRDIQYPGRSVVMASGAMVATSQPMATAAALRILRRGGNAMDAAVAASATLCVTEPLSTGIGGDCFLLYHEAGTGELHALNGSGRAPGRATPDFLRAHDLTMVPERGILSVTVPGAVDAWQTAVERFGTCDFGALLQPAIEYAENGFAVTPVVAGNWKNHAELFRGSSDSAQTFLVDDRAPVAGSLHHFPDLARSLRLIAEQGKDALYRGALAEEIIRFSHEHNGLLELDDLAGHRSEWVEPVSSSYRDLTIFEVPPNSQGITTLMTLNILEQAGLRDLQHLSPEHIHLVIEAFKLARAEGARYIADPVFSEVPVQALLSEQFAQQQYARIDAATAMPCPVAPGLPEHRDTVYLTVVDRDRNIVSFINSLYHPGGSGMVAGSSGILLQNRGACFVLDEEHANCIAPGKRPMHTIIPALACRDGEPVLSFGVMGGSYQPLGQAWVISNWLDFGMDFQEAIDAPRFHVEDGMLVVERPVPQATRQALARLGHQVTEAETPIGGAQMIYIDRAQGVLHAASDPRKDGCALGY